MGRSKLSERAHELVCGDVLTDEELLRNDWYPVPRSVFDGEMNVSELKSFIETVSISYQDLSEVLFVFPISVVSRVLDAAVLHN